MLRGGKGVAEFREFKETCVDKAFVGGLEVGFVSACSWLALVTGVGGYVLAGVQIGVLSVYFSIFAGVRVVGVCVLVYARIHTQTTGVLDVSPGVGRTPGGPEESRSTKAQYICRPYRCTQYICLVKIAFIIARKEIM